MSIEKQYPYAFPKTHDPYPNVQDDVNPSRSNGMELRDYFAAHAPISLEFACHVLRREVAIRNEVERAEVLAMWTALRYEWADTMMNQRDKNNEQ